MVVVVVFRYLGVSGSAARKEETKQMGGKNNAFFLPATSLIPLSFSSSEACVPLCMLVSFERKAPAHGDARAKGISREEEKRMRMEGAGMSEPDCMAGSPLEASRSQRKKTRQMSLFSFPLWNIFLVFLSPLPSSNKLTKYSSVYL